MQQPPSAPATTEAKQTMSAAPPPGGRGGDGAACDFCENQMALVHCVADDARLCLACDRRVHEANAVSSKHPRSLLCNVCGSASSSIFCSTHGLLFCHNCDFEGHSPDGPAHDRRPVEPFSGCPAADELLDLLGVGLDEKELSIGPAGGGSDDYGSEVVRESWVWETPPVLCLDDLIVPASVDHGYQAVGMPPLPKTHNLTCGNQKEEIIQQIRSMAQSELSMSNQFWKDEEDLGFHHLAEQEQFDFSDTIADVSDNYRDDVSVWQGKCRAAMDSLALPQTCTPERCTENDQPYAGHQEGTDSHTNQDETGDMGDGQWIPGEVAQSLPTKYVNELTGPERDSAISRYREKRKARRYGKQIRYESRKTRAKGRARIKGRFAKVDPNAKP